MAYNMQLEADLNRLDRDNKNINEYCENMAFENQ